jgi:hypothetical protein
MKRGKLVFMFLFVIMIYSVSGMDVAYIYRNERRIDWNFVDVFTEMGLTTDFISEVEMPLDLSAYKIIFVGDEKFRKEINVNKYPSVVSNYRHGYDWGLTDRNGVSQMGASRPLKVVMNGDIVQVYDRAFKRGRSAVPYYYLNENSKSEAMNQIWGTQTTSTGRKFGDVISYVDAGSTLENMQTANGNICFYGIVFSDFWTDEARELLKECVSFVAGGIVVPYPPAHECIENIECGMIEFSDYYCFERNVLQDVTSHMCVISNDNFCESETVSNMIETCSFSCENGACVDESPDPNIECLSDLDCPLDIEGVNYCAIGTDYYDENVYRIITDYSCLNPGTEFSECVFEEREELIEDCSLGCIDSMCVVESQGIHDVSLIDHEGAVNGIRIETSEEFVVGEGEDLICGDRYRIIINVANYGDFYENLSFVGNAGGIDFSHISTSLDVGIDKVKTRTITLDLSEGNYTISVEVLINGFVDDNPVDNLMMREFSVICPI